MLPVMMMIHSGSDYDDDDSDDGDHKSTQLNLQKGGQLLVFLLSDLQLLEGLRLLLTENCADLLELFAPLAGELVNDY